MYTKHYLVISGIVGGIIGRVLTALLVSPVTAQRDKFGDIECGTIRCSGLTIVDAIDRDAKLGVSLGYAPGHGGYVYVNNGNGKPRVRLSGSFLNNAVDVVRNQKVVVSLTDAGGTKSLGGFITVEGRNPTEGVSVGLSFKGMSVDVYGGEDGKSTASLVGGKHGGRVEVSGKGKGAAVMAINENGNGAVSTWDKNGYRQ